MKRLPLVSILMPTYNAEAYLESSIESVLQQSFENWELLICDDCSTDNSINKILLFKDKRIKVIKNTTNKGYLKTFNLLLNKAKGDFITFLDSDDLMAQLRVEKQVEYLMLNKATGLVGTNYARISNDNKIYWKSDLPRTHDELLLEISRNKTFPFCGSSVMIKREVMATVGGYREYFNGCPGEDVDWIRRISEKYEVANIDYLGYFYRFSPTSLTRKPKRDIKARHINEIIIFLADQRKKKGFDDLMTNGNALKEFETQLHLPYTKNPSLIHRKLSLEYSIQKSWKMAISHSFIGIKKNPVSIKNWVILWLNILLLITPFNLLLQIKTVLNINHVSERL